MQGRNGVQLYERQGIADAFADFYADLYGARSASESAASQPWSAIPEFSLRELKREIKELKKGKSRDRQGVDAELLNEGGKPLEDELLWHCTTIA